MNRSVHIIFLVVGVIILVLGVIEADSIGSSFSRLFTGEPTDRALWLMVGGAVSTILGLVGVSRGSN